MSSFKKAIRSFLWRTGLGKNIAAAFWKKKSSGRGLRYLHYAKKDVLEGIPVKFREGLFEQFLEDDIQRWRVQEEFVLQIDNALVEPERCLVTQNFNELVEQSVVYKAHYQYPYILPYLLNRGRAKGLDEAVLYDGSATRNYFHHLVDAVSSLYMFSRSGLPNDIPFIVNRFVYEQKFFQHLLEKSETFRSINWRVVEKNEWLKVKTLYKVQSFSFDKATWDYTRSLYNIKDIKPFRKVFLNRDKELYSRCLSNEEEIIAMLERYGFETVYAEHLSADEQMSLFQETKHLVALTGMGLIQQFFMNYTEAHIIEIIPANRLMPEYYCQAYTLGIRYFDVVIGDPIPGLKLNAATGLPPKIENLKLYHLDATKLEEAVVRMLDPGAQQHLLLAPGKNGKATAMA